jgi:peptidoglycan/xylan/chitin deacetylase (PgdA/CDA1 family)
MRVRDDDVLMHSRRIKDVVRRFKGVHEHILRLGAVHVVALLETELQEFPEGIKYIKEEFLNGRMEAQFHGNAHVDYAKKTYLEIREDIQQGQRFFDKHFGVPFSTFYTPWGANAEHILHACEDEGVKMVDCSNIAEPGWIIEHWGKKDFTDREILIHWWRAKDLEELDAIHALDPEYLVSPEYLVR